MNRSRATRRTKDWIDDPELLQLARRLRAADLATRAAAEAEAVIAQRLIERGAAVRFEVPTPTGRTCDFEVKSAGHILYLHVKRLRSGPQPQTLRVSLPLRKLEEIPRAIVLAVRWRDGLRAPDMTALIKAAEEFAREASIGDELVARDRDGRELGGCRIVSPSNGPHVQLLIGLPEGFLDEVPRVQRLLRRAYRQFMPGGTNVILIAGQGPADERDVETALLGSHVERWDRLPRRGQRVAHGRADDGFWHGSGYDQSQAAAWFAYSSKGGLRTRLWLRSPSRLERGIQQLLRRLLEQ